MPQEMTQAGGKHRTGLTAPIVSRRLRGLLGPSPRNIVLFFTLAIGVSSGFQIAKDPGPQADKASIEGLITLDGQQGQAEAVPGVLVTLKGPSSGVESHSDTTDAEGHYRFAQLSPGTYTIEARLDGFQSFAESIVVSQGESKVENVSLTLDLVVQKIDVQDKASGGFYR